MRSCLLSAPHSRRVSVSQLPGHLSTRPVSNKPAARGALLARSSSYVGPHIGTLCTIGMQTLALRCQRGAALCTAGAVAYRPAVAKPHNPARQRKPEPKAHGETASSQQLAALPPTRHAALRSTLKAVICGTQTTVPHNQPVYRCHQDRARVSPPAECARVSMPMSHRW
eukprot:COSAG06_NODE_7440_length_2502_cov_24.216396_2_plen_169_part_00